jgi:dinuclear metal center YbgI/SA1388 family protein
MLIREITNYLEKLAPISLQESYDNSGLLIGSYNKNIEKALITLDVTEEVINEAINENCGLIISHHPIIFKGLKKLTGSNLTERLVIMALKSDIAIYAIHTNLDNVLGGVNGILAEKLGIKNPKILSPKTGELLKVVTFCPSKHMENVQQAMFDAGAGNIGNYDNCSYYTDGTGTFRALEGSNPYVGEANKLHKEQEYRIETIVPKHRLTNVVNAMIKAHPYEEPAYDIYSLDNTNAKIGSGIIGELESAIPIKEYLFLVKQTLGTKFIKHNQLIERPVKNVAVCGGSGSFLIDDAARHNADLFITGDVKYHEFFEYSGNMTIADAGHYETEHLIKELLYTVLKKKIPNFALQISKKNANPIFFL